VACGKPPEHDADNGEADERSDGGGIAFEVARQTAVAADPCERPLDDPAFGQNLKSGISRTFTERSRPPRLAGAIGSTISHSASLRSLG